MNQPIDVDAFIAQLADDNRLAREVAGLSTPVPAARLAPAVEIAALEVELWAVDARDSGDWATFGERIRESVRGAFEGLAEPAPFVPQPGDGELLREIERKLWERNQDGDR